MAIYNLLEQSKNYSKNQEVCRIITETKLMMLMLMMLFECKKEKVGQAPERSQKSQNPGSTDQPAQPPVPS